MASTQEAATDPPGLPGGRFAGRREFAEMIRHAFAAAAAQGWREIILSDPDFGDWPLGEREVAQALNDWCKTGRKFMMLAENYDAVLARHARFVAWRRAWSHLVECRANKATPGGRGVPSALWSPGWMFERLDARRCSGVAGVDGARRVALRQRLNERLLDSSAAFAATVLGL